MFISFRCVIMWQMVRRHSTHIGHLYSDGFCFMVNKSHVECMSRAPRIILLRFVSWLVSVCEEASFCGFLFWCSGQQGRLTFSFTKCHQQSFHTDGILDVVWNAEQNFQGLCLVNSHIFVNLNIIFIVWSLIVPNFLKKLPMKHSNKLQFFFIPSTGSLYFRSLRKPAKC